MGIGDAIIRGWTRALSHPILILLKWLMNLSFAYLILGPLAVFLSDHLDEATAASGLETQTTIGYTFEFFQVYSGQIEGVRMYWVPLLIIFLILNLFLSGGVLAALQQDGRFPLNQLVRSCLKHITPLSIALVLTGFTAGFAIIMPLHLLELGVRALEETSFDKPTLLIIYWSITGVISLILLIWTGMGRKSGKPQAFKLKLGLTGLILAFLTVAAPLLYLEDIFNHIIRDFPNKRLVLQVYWFGFTLIMLITGTWVFRVYHVLRLRVCRPGDPRNVLFDPFTQWFKAMAFTTRHYGATLILWIVFLLFQLGAIPLGNLLNSALPEDAKFIAAQITLAYRIAASFALAAAFSAYLTPRMRVAQGSPPPQNPEEPSQPKSDEGTENTEAVSPAQPELYQEDESLKTEEKVQWIPEEKADQPDEVSQVRKERIEWIPMEPELEANTDETPDSNPQSENRSP